MSLPRSESGQVVSLAWQPLPEHPSARSRVLIKGDSLEVVQLVLQAGACMPRHAAPGEITLMGLEGRLLLGLGDRDVRVGPGEFIHLARGVPHTVRAEADSLALLTICLHRAPPVSGAVFSEGSSVPR